MLLWAYGWVLLLWALRPFAPETSLAAMGAKLTNDWWVPLRFLGQRVDLFSVVDVVSPFFLYLPLGGLLAVWPLARRGWLANFWPAVYLARGHGALPGPDPGEAPRLDRPSRAGRRGTRGLDGPAPGRLRALRLAAASATVVTQRRRFGSVPAPRCGRPRGPGSMLA